MFLRRKPSDEFIRNLVSEQHGLPFSYSEVGATRHELPAGYIIDHNRVKLGTGEQVFSRAVKALTEWRQFDLGWVKAVPEGSVLEVNAVIAILTRHLGFWSLNASRVVYLLDESRPVRKFGFAYGTLPEHVERGEERFTIEWWLVEDTVWYDILAFSRPNKVVARLGLPFTRLLQKRFARDSKRRMVEYVKG